jgi:hypothetical protein
VHALSFSQISGTVSNAQVPVGAVTQYDTTILASAALTGTPTAPTATTTTATTQIATTAFVNPGQSIASNGYKILPGGFYFQFGFAQANGASPGVVGITFPIAFPNAWLCGGGSTKRSTAGTAGSNFVCSTPAPTVNGMSMVFDALDGLNNVTNGGYWWAIGH